MIDLLLRAVAVGNLATHTGSDTQEPPLPGSLTARGLSPIVTTLGSVQIGWCGGIQCEMSPRRTKSA